MSEPAPGRRIPLPLALMLGAALLVGLLAVVGEVENWRRESRPDPARPARGDGRVLPGQRVDFITLGLPIEHVEATLGEGKVRPRSDSLLYLYEEAGVNCAVVDGRVTSILVQNPNLTTADRIGVGTDVDRVVRTFGEGYEFEERDPRDYTLHYWPQGIHFFVKEAAVAGILITEPVLEGAP